MPSRIGLFLDDFIFGILFNASKKLFPFPGNLLLPDTLKEALSGATAVVSCFVSFDGN